MMRSQKVDFVAFNPTVPLFSENSRLYKQGERARRRSDETQDVTVDVFDHVLRRDDGPNLAFWAGAGTPPGRSWNA
jgi:hypothetical protein